MRPTFLSLALIPFVTCIALAQQESVRPGINDKFTDATTADLNSFVERFEKEGREVFDSRQDIIASCQLRPAMVIADVGAGTGLFTRLMAPKVAKVLAVDINQNFLDHVTKSAAGDGLKNVETVLCDQSSANLPENSVDLVFICDTYHHFEYPYKTMRSIWRSLKPDGIVVLVEFDRIEGKSSEWILGHVRADRETFTKEIVNSGFEEIELRDDFFKTSYLKRFKKSKRVTEKGHTLDTVAEVKANLENGTAALLDVREQKEWDAGSLKQASLFQLSELGKLLDQPEKIKARVPQDKIVYLHCRAGGRAVRAGKALESLGIDVRPLSLGFGALTKEGFETNK